LRAADIFILHEGKILLLKRLDQGAYGGIWYIPGGVVEPGEDEVTAAAREALEESGLQVANLVRFREWSHHDVDDSTVHVTTCIGWSDSVAVRLSEEHSAYKWVTPDRDILNDLQDRAASSPAFASWLEGAQETLRLFVEWLSRPAPNV